MNLPARQIMDSAQDYLPDMTRFLRDMIRIPSESCQEKQVIDRIAEEMRLAGLDRVETDPMGNLLGYLGSGRHLLALDAHVDTVGVGDPDLWTVDPFEGKEDHETIWGRGASDQKGGMAAMVYAARVARELDLLGDSTLLLVGSVQEEDCDGLCWQYIISEGGVRPELVVSTEPTACRIHRGQRGRMEIRVRTAGLSCHGSAPERGDNAIYKMAPIVEEVRDLGTRPATDEFLGAGSLTVSEIFFSSPSRCAVPDGCTISIDRRLTQGETADTALAEIRALRSVRSAGAEVAMYDYSKPSYTGLVYPTEAYFPTWQLEPDHLSVAAMQRAYRGLFGEEPAVGKWTFSTNGVAITGRFGIPTVGFGPGHEDQAHAPDERTWKQELVRACGMYAALPFAYLEGMDHAR